MKFHLRTLELLGHPDLPLEPEREAWAVRSAAAFGVSLPAAVAEWYRVPEQSELWRWYLGFPQDDYRTSWANPPVCRDARGWVKGPILRLVSENYGSWEWGVLLDETADPPVVASTDEGETWDTCADSFSSKVYSIVFDAIIYGGTGVGRDFAIPHRVSSSHRQALRREFHAGPVTRGIGWNCTVLTERFSRPGQRFNFFEHGSAAHSSLWASDLANFVELVDRLHRIFPSVTGLLPEHDRPRDESEIPF